VGKKHKRESDEFVRRCVELLLLLVFQNNVCFRTQTHCGTDLKQRVLGGFGLCLLQQQKMFQVGAASVGDQTS
jgi:hypothetical protein